MENKPLFSVVIPTYNRKERLIRLLDSILESNYSKDKLEIIVVDDTSTDGTYTEVKKRFPEVRIVRNKRELYLASSRNVGIKNAKAEYIFIIDDDNIVDKNCISELVKVFSSDLSIGIVAPIMYYLKQPNRVWCAGIKRNMVTSLTIFICRDETDEGQFNELIESKDFPNAFVVKREVIDRVRLFDEKTFPIHYDEADFGERVRKAGYKIVCNPKAKIWHDVPLPEKIKEKARLFHVHNEFRAYYCGRNRIAFHKKYSKWWQFMIFILVFNWLFTIYYLEVIIVGSKQPLKKRLKIEKAYLKGVVKGLRR